MTISVNYMAVEVGEKETLLKNKIVAVNKYLKEQTADCKKLHFNTVLSDLFCF